MKPSDENVQHALIGKSVASHFTVVDIKSTYFINFRE